MNIADDEDFVESLDERLIELHMDHSLGRWPKVAHYSSEAFSKKLELGTRKEHLWYGELEQEQDRRNGKRTLVECVFTSKR